MPFWRDFFLVGKNCKLISSLFKKGFFGGYEIQKFDPYHRCMVYLPTFIMKINHSCIGKYTMPMDSVWVMKNWEQILAAFAAQRLLRCPISLSGDSAFGISPHFGETQIFMENKSGWGFHAFFCPLKRKKTTKKCPTNSQQLRKSNSLMRLKLHKIPGHLSSANSFFFIGSEFIYSTKIHQNGYNLHRY